MLLLGLVADQQHVVLHGGHRRLGIVDRVGQRVGQVPLDELVHAIIQCGGEQQALAFFGCGVQELLHDRKEAEVGHVVGLVQDSDFDGVQSDELLAHQVLKAARAGDDNVDAGAQCLFLAGLGDTAVNDRGVQAEHCSKWLNGGVDLGGELAGWCEDQRQGATWLPAVGGFLLGQTGHHGKCESEGLP